MTKIICVGDVMVDVLARLPGPLRARSDTPAPITVLGGGSAANTAAWLGVIGADVTLVGRTGDDAYGRGQRVQLIASGVDLALSVDPTLPTGTCIVLVELDGERTMVPDAGANSGLTTADLPTALFASGNHLHLSGYALFGTGRPAALAALELARSNAMTVSVGAASAGPLETAGAEEFLGWIGSDLLLFANDDEARVLSGLDDCVEAARLLAARVGRVVVTRGADTVLWCDGPDLIEAPSAATDVCDSTGSGDAFSAGVIAALVDGATPRAALRRGHELAARACRTVGPRPPIGGASASAH